MLLKRIILIVVTDVLFSFMGFSQGNSFNVKTYGAVGDGITLDTKSINKAINACVNAGGGTVYFPAGTFVTGSFRIFSNVHLYLAAGSVILASKDEKDFFLQKDYGFSGSGTGERIGIVFAHDAENISITGEGVIDGRGANFMYMDSIKPHYDMHGTDFKKRYTRQGEDYLNVKYGVKMNPVLWKDTYHQPGTELIFSSCKKVTITGITIRNAGNWSMSFLKCDDAKVLGISIKNIMSIPNSDGIDSYDSKNVLISNCDIRAGDDAIALISSNNVSVTNCTLTSRSSGIRIGYNVFNDAPSGNLLFNNIRIYGANRGIGIFQRRKGNMENIIFSNMIIDTRLYTGQWWGHGEPIHISALPGIGSDSVGEIKNIQFNNIIATGEEGIVIYGSKESVLKNISFNNVQLTLKKGGLTNSYGGNFDLRPTNDIRLGIFKHDIPALYATNVDGLKIKDLQVETEGKLPAFFTYAIQCEDFANLTINGVTGYSPDKKLPMIDIENGKNAIIQNVNDLKRLIHKNVLCYQLK
jgi:polygalacturonase